MARNGAGVYSLPAGSTAVTGTTIESAKYNAVIDDLEADLNTARPVVAGGTGATTGADAMATLGGVITFATRAAFVTWAGSASPTVGNVAKSGDLKWVYDGAASLTGIPAGWKPVEPVFVEHFGAVGDDSTDNTSAILAADTYVGANGLGALHFGGGVFQFGVTTLSQDNVSWVGLGGGYTPGEYVQRDKAKVLADAPTVLKYNGAANGVWITRRPQSFFARRKIAGGGARDICFDGVTGTNKAGIILREQNVEFGAFERCSFLGSTSRMADVTGMISGFSDGDNNSAYTRFKDCLFTDKVVDGAGANKNGGGHCMVLGGEFNATNIYLDDCQMVSASGSTEEMVIENTDHCVFENVRCNVGGATSHAYETGVFNSKSVLRYKDEQNGGFTAGDTVTGATSGATATVDEVREGASGGFGVIFLTSASAPFTAGENLQVSATTRGVAEDRTHIKVYGITGSLTVAATLTGATSGATMVIDEVFLDPADTSVGVVFAEAGNVTGTFTAGEDLEISSTKVCEAANTQVVIGSETAWETFRSPNAVSRYNQFIRWFGDLTFKASTTTTTHSVGNIVIGYSTVDPFGIGFPTIEHGAIAHVYADAAPGDHGNWEPTPISFGGQPASACAHISAGQNHTTSGSWQTVTWDEELHDPLSTMSGATWNDINIPAGVNFVKITAGVEFDASATGQRGLRSFFTGTGVTAQPDGNLEMICDAAAAGVTTLNATSRWLPVRTTETDWTIRLQTYQDSGGTLGYNSVNTWVEVEFK